MTISKKQSNGSKVVHGNQEERKKEEDDGAHRWLRVGTSGWSYKEWEKIFYPDSKTPKLKFYSSLFNTAEIDSTFYANPTRGLVYGWARNTPEKFKFSVKIPRSITHDKKLDLAEGAEVELVKFLDLLRPLNESGKLGPLLIQLPPSFGLSARKSLEEFFEALPKGYSFAVEFRNKSWLRDPKLHSLLHSYGVANTIVDEPLMPVDTTPTSDEFAFIRWHGRGSRPWYNYLYSSGELDPWVEKIRKISTRVRSVYGYFNNHFHGNAVENSLEFLEKLGAASIAQQQELAEIRERRAEGLKNVLTENDESFIQTGGGQKKKKKMNKRMTPVLEPAQTTLGEF